MPPMPDELPICSSPLRPEVEAAKADGRWEAAYNYSGSVPSLKISRYSS